MSESDRAAILSAFDDLRVTDVRDGMDTVGLHYTGSMDPAIRPLLRMSAVGIARTCRYVSFDGSLPTLTGEAYWDWVEEYYRDVCPYPWVDEIEPGDFVVIDQSDLNVGLMGSENTLACLRNGARGLVSNGGVRDTDEVIMQKVPFWSRMVSQTMVQGRLKYADHNSPVEVGGTVVNPGDVIVADGDGIVVVPRALALDVAQAARAEHERDKVRRGDHYRALGWSLDGSVK